MRKLFVLTAVLLLAFSIPAQAQFARVWKGAPPASETCYPGTIGLDVTTPQLYICGQNADGTSTGWIRSMTPASTSTLTNKTFDTAGTGNVFRINGTQITDKTGTGKAVLDTTPTFTTSYVVADANGSTKTCGVANEQVTLGTGATTTDTTANLLPANSLILAVSGRVTTTITGSCTGWSLGDATTAARFSANDTTLTANETKVGLAHLQGGISTDAAGPVQASAAKVRITCAGGNPSAGVIRVSVQYCTFVGPTN